MGGRGVGAFALPIPWGTQESLGGGTPDANRFLLVDKTDLIVNSTEFCFGSTGR